MTEIFDCDKRRFFEKKLLKIKADLAVLVSNFKYLLEAGQKRSKIISVIHWVIEFCSCPRFDGRVDCTLIYFKLA